MVRKELEIKDLILYIHSSAVFQLLHAGVELKLFELLHNSGRVRINKISNLLKIKEESLSTLLFGLTSLRLISKNKDKYQNSRLIETLFKEGEWKLFESMVMIQAYIMYPGQEYYLESLRKNSNVGIKRFSGRGKTVYERLEHNKRLKKIFYDYMEEYSKYSSPHLISKVNFSKIKSILDVGGGAGGNAISIIRRNPQIKITLIDLPLVKSLAESRIKENNFSSKITFYPANIFKDKFPNKYDAILFIHQLVIWSLEDNKILLKKAYDSLNDGGEVIIFSSISDNNKVGPLMAALDTVYFRSVAAGNGEIYSWKDYEKILKEVGFKKVKKIKCKTWTPHGIIIGHK